MSDQESTKKPSSRAQLRESALSRWDNEGGAERGGSAQQPAACGPADDGTPPLTNAELVRLQVRVIALENVVLALLAEASVRQLELVREMAARIAPRPGHTPHRLTIDAAARMVSLVDEAEHLREEAPPQPLPSPP